LKFFFVTYFFSLLNALTFNFSKAKDNLIGVGGCVGLFFTSYGIIVDLGAGKGPEVVPGAPVG